ncbi:MAG: DUF2812 domain-containing protein [Clostridia bacterium]|nr:DUF2812 domain-containing protein [Clostridia bacterium]
MSKKTSDPNTMKVRLRYRYTDLMALSEYLERQAQRGWYLTSLASGTFTAGEKKIVRYCVEVIPEADRIADDRASGGDDGFKELLTLCEESGWTFVCHKDDICVFMSNNPRSPAIVTDRAAKVDAVRKAERRGRILAWAFVASLLMEVILFLLPWNENRTAAVWIVEGAAALIAATFVYLAVESLVNERRWLKLEREAEAAGWPVPYFDTEYTQKRDKRERIVVLIMAAAAMCALIVGILFM